MKIFHFHLHDSGCLGIVLGKNLSSEEHPVWWPGLALFFHFGFAMMVVGREEYTGGYEHHLHLFIRPCGYNRLCEYVVFRIRMSWWIMSGVVYYPSENISC